MLSVPRSIFLAFAVSLLPAGAAETGSFPVLQSQNGTIRIPIEVVNTGRAPEWRYIEVPAESIPEPGSAMLALISMAALLMRRHRPERA